MHGCDFHFTHCATRISIEAPLATLGGKHRTSSSVPSERSDGKTGTQREIIFRIAHMRDNCASGGRYAGSRVFLHCAQVPGMTKR